jgi:hypothetical protein
MMANPAALRIMIEPRNSSRTASHLVKPLATAKMSRHCNAVKHTYLHLWTENTPEDLHQLAIRSP